MKIKTFLAGLFILGASFATQAASLIYDSYMMDVLTGGVVSTDTYKCALVTSSYTPVRASHTRFSQITNEISVSGYTAGGQSVVPTFAYDGTTHAKINITFPALTWTANISARGAVCYKSTGTASTSPLVFYNDFGSTISETGGGTFTVGSSTLSATAQ